MEDTPEVLQDTVETVYFLGNRINDNTLRYIGIGLGIFLLFVLLRKVLSKSVLKILLRITRTREKEIGKKITEAFKKPLAYLFIVFGAYFGISFLGKAFLLNLFKEPILVHIFKSAIIILTAWAFYNMTTEQSILYEELSSKLNFKLDKIVFPFLAAIFRFIIFGLAICVILDEWGYNVNGFIAGLGIGGLAFALAAQDTIANLFGGFVIILDKPFSIGDYIKTQNVEGIVEDINLRSTKIRTMDKGLVTEPNSSIAKSTITNLTKRDTRRIYFTIGVTYDTSKEQLENCITKIKEMLYEDEDILNESIIVNFDKFASSSLDILIDCFANTADLRRYLRIKENINLKIMDILENEGVSMAFPTTSVYFKEESADDHFIDRNKK